MMKQINSLLRRVAVKTLPIRAQGDGSCARQVVDLKHLAAMTLIILVGVAFGAGGLNADIVWLDEVFSLSNMGAFNPPYSPQDVIRSLRDYSPDHVPLYFVLGAQWAQLVGWTQLPMRYLSLLFGALLIAAVYRFASATLGQRTALMAALLLSTNAFVVLYFHEIRMYTLLLFLAVLHSWVYWRLAMGNPASRRSWIFFIVTAVAVIYTHVFSFYFFAGLLAQHLVFVSKSRRWLAIVACWSIALLAFLPYVTVFSKGFFGVTTSANTISNALTAPDLAASMAQVLVNDMIVLWLPIVILTGLALRAKRQLSFLRLLSIFVVMLLALFVVNGVFHVIGINRMRYFLLTMPFFVVVTAHLLLSIRRWRGIAVLFVIVWVAGGYRVHRLAEHWPLAGHHTLLMDHPPLQVFADALHGGARPQDFIVGFADSPMISWPLKHGWTTADYYTQAVLGIDGAFINARLRGDELQEHIVQRLDNNPFLLFTYDPREEPIIFDDVLAAIQAHYTSCEVVVDQERVFVQRYVYATLSCDREYQPIHYENGIKILDRFGDYDSERQSVRVVTGWEVADEAQLEEYNISIQILTHEGRNVRQAGDRHLYDNILKWYVAEISTDGLAPGNYRAVVILYDRYSKAKISGADLISGESATILPIMNFKLEA